MLSTELVDAIVSKIISCKIRSSPFLNKLFKLGNWEIKICLALGGMQKICHAAKGGGGYEGRVTSIV